MIEHRAKGIGLRAKGKGKKLWRWEAGKVGG